MYWYVLVCTAMYLYISLIFTMLFWFWLFVVCAGYHHRDPAISLQHCRRSWQLNPYNPTQVQQEQGFRISLGLCRVCRPCSFGWQAWLQRVRGQHLAVELWPWNASPGWSDCLRLVGSGGGIERDQMKFAVFWKYVPVRNCIYLYVLVCTCT